MADKKSLIKIGFLTLILALFVVVYIVRAQNFSLVENEETVKKQEKNLNSAIGTAIFSKTSSGRNFQGENNILENLENFPIEFSQKVKETTKKDVMRRDQIRERTFEVNLKGERFVPEPRKGKELNDYFKSLNLEEEEVYVMIQFESVDGDPSLNDVEILNEDGISLFEYHGDHVYFAKAPLSVLQTKSYSFVRWAGIIENPINKVNPETFEYLNSMGEAEVTVIPYEKLTEKQINLLSQFFNIQKNNRRGSLFGTIKPNEINNLLSLNFVKTVEPYIKPSPTLDKSSQVISADFVWDYPNDGSGITVGIIDSGIESANDHFVAINLHDAYDYVQNDTDPEDEGSGHGVQVAGIISGQGSFQDRTLRGISWKSDLVIQRVFDEGGIYSAPPASDPDIWENILDPDNDDNFNEESSADVISNSWSVDGLDSLGVDGDYDDMSAQVDSVVLGDLGKAIPIIFTAGNDYWRGASYEKVDSPTTSKNAIAVGATGDYFSSDNEDGSGAWDSDPDNLYVMDYSERTTDDGRVKPDILAPGSDITTTALNNTYLTGLDGTSFAGPHVAAVAAQILKQYPSLSPAGVKAFLIAGSIGGSTTNNIDYDKVWGRLNAYKAVYKLPDEYIDTYDEDVVGEILSGEDETRCYDVSIPTDAESLVVTLTWDDVAGDKSGDGTKTLYNDIDLWLKNETDGTLVWTVDDDDINNVERYVIDNPNFGIWEACVSKIDLDGFGTGEQEYAIKIEVLKQTTTPSLNVELNVDDSNPSVGQNVTVYATVTVNGLLGYDILADLDVSSGLDIVSGEFDGSDEDKDRIGDVSVGKVRRSKNWTVNVVNEGSETISINLEGMRINGENYNASDSIVLNIGNETEPPSGGGILYNCIEPGYDQCIEFNGGDGCVASIAVNHYESVNNIRWGAVNDSFDPYVISNYTFGWKERNSSNQVYYDVADPNFTLGGDLFFGGADGIRVLDEDTRVTINAPGIASREIILAYDDNLDDVACAAWFNDFGPNYGPSNPIYVLNCFSNSDCQPNYYCDKSGGWSDWRCTPKKSDGQSCSNIGECLSGYCDNDGVGLPDDNLCFSPYENFFDGGETTYCEYSTGSGDVDCDEKQIGDGCNAECRVSTNVPTVPTIISPNGGGYLDTLLINWTISNDINKDFVRYNLQYSNNSGDTWNSLISSYGFENRLNDSSVTKLLEFTKSQDQIVNIRIPKNAKVTHAKIDLEGLPA